MPRVHSAIANKDYPGIEVKKGERYYYWFPYKSARRISKVSPKPSVIEGNPTRAVYLGILEELEELVHNSTSPEDIREGLHSAADQMDEVVEELREKASNIEEGFQHPTETSELFSSQADELENWVNEAYSVADEIEDIDSPGEYPEEPPTEDAQAHSDWEKAVGEYEQAESDYEEALENAQSSVEDLVASVPEV